MAQKGEEGSHGKKSLKSPTVNLSPAPRVASHHHCCRSSLISSSSPITTKQPLSLLKITENLLYIFSVTAAQKGQNSQKFPACALCD
ncbi:hypothetical protein SLEP1_g48219 [Rubroshorea leprosula]|uniref:Uncharacterized protein n=1 Tax=Rubroshorea leprosula TaxID=152421 RepID=A0AAV5LUV7_9ROSI|nr:hypothetical protein SLEP1_g48219 [Rubroshorea leprosula]